MIVRILIGFHALEVCYCIFLNVVLYVLIGSCDRPQIFYIFIWRIFYSLTLDKLGRREDNVETKLILWKLHIVESCRYGKLDPFSDIF